MLPADLVPLLLIHEPDGALEQSTSNSGASNRSETTLMPCELGTGFVGRLNYTDGKQIPIFIHDLQLSRSPHFHAHTSR
jgi:hypothetical protein